MKYKEIPYTERIEITIENIIEKLKHDSPNELLKAVDVLEKNYLQYKAVLNTLKEFNNERCE